MSIIHRLIEKIEEQKKTIDILSGQLEDAKDRIGDLERHIYDYRRQQGEF